MENISLSGAIQGDLKNASKKKLQTHGNPARASAMQAQYQQPVIGPRTGAPPLLKRFRVRCLTPCRV